MLMHEGEISLFMMATTTKSRCVKHKDSSEPKFWGWTKREISIWLKKFRDGQKK